MVEKKVQSQFKRWVRRRLRFGTILWLAMPGLLSLAQQPGAPAHAAVSASSDAEQAFAPQIAAMPPEDALKLIASADAVRITEGLSNALKQIAEKASMQDPQHSLDVERECEAVAKRAGQATLAADARLRIALRMVDLGDASGSIAVYDQAKTMYLAAQAPPKTLVGVYLNRAIANLHTGDLQAAVDDDNEALRISRQIGDDISAARAENGLGNALREKGSFTESEAAYMESLRLARAKGERLGEAFALNNLSVLHSIEEDYPTAVKFCEQSLEIKRQVGSKANIAKSLANLANYYNVLGRPEDATRALTEALQIAREINSKSLIAGTTAQMGIIQLDQHHTEAGLKLLLESLGPSSELEDKESFALTIRKIAEASFDLKLYPQALKYALQAAEITRKEGMLDQMSDADLVVGTTYLQLGQLKEARAALEESVSAIEQLRNNISGGASARQQFMQHRSEPYRMLSIVAGMEGDWPIALDSSERCKGRILLDVYTGNGLSASASLTDAERAEESRLRGNFLTLDMQFDRQSSMPRFDPIKKNELDASLHKAKAEMNGYREQLYARHPELRLRRADFIDLSLKDMQKLVPDKSTALLEYELSPNGNYLFVVTRGPKEDAEIHGYKLAVADEDLIRHVHRYHNQLASRDPEFAAEARWLFAALLKPAGAQLSGLASIVIVPDGVLWDLPFQALQRADGSYLVEKTAIDYVPSLAVLHALKSIAPRTRAARTLLAMGNPGGETPEQADETLAVGKLYAAGNVTTFVGKAATLAQFRQSSSSFDVVHLAAHGIYDDREPMASHMLLASAPGQAQAGWLRAREIQAMQLHAELVVLSGCETGKGAFEDGEGLVGMSWATLAAGAHGALASAWRVEANSTTEMMLAFHLNMLRGVNKAEALRRAELKVLRDKNTSHPFYWAAFVLMGDGTS